MFGNGKGSDLEHRAEQIRSEAESGLRELSRNARSTGEDVKKEAIKLLNNAADLIRREARQTNASKEVRGGADDVARGLEKAAHYLKKNSFEDMGEDMTKSVQRNPWRTIGIIFVVGIIIGMMLRGDDERVEYRVVRDHYPPS